MNQNSVTQSNVVALWQRRDAMINPVVSDLIRYWEGLRQGADVPRRADVDPRQIKEALSYSFILDHVRPGTVRFRLAGQHLTELMGMDVRGMPLTALFTPESRNELSARLEALFDASQVLRMTLSGERGIGRPAMEGEMLILPLRDDRGAVSRALGCLATEGRPGRVPRRFRIVAARARPLVPHGQAGAGRVTAPGLAEAAAGYTPAPKGERGAPRPALKLVRPGD